MNTIKRNNLKKEMEILEAISKEKIAIKKKWQKLEDMGYIIEELGTGGSAYICSGDVHVKKLNSKNYLSGEYLVYGISNNYGVYRGYCKKIV